MVKFEKIEISETEITVSGKLHSSAYCFIHRNFITFANDNLKM